MKRILHLPEGITNGMLYSRKCDGGLGILKLENIIQAANLKAFSKMMKGGDPFVDAIMRQGRRREMEDKANKMEVG